MTMSAYHRPKPPYLKPNRLNDVVAALQMMGLNNRYRLAPEDWAERISGDRMKADYWSGIFADHPESFERRPKIWVTTRLWCVEHCLAGTTLSEREL